MGYMKPLLQSTLAAVCFFASSAVIQAQPVPMSFSAFSDTYVYGYGDSEQVVHYYSAIDDSGYDYAHSDYQLHVSGLAPSGAWSDDIWDLEGEVAHPFIDDGDFTTYFDISFYCDLGGGYFGTFGVAAAASVRRFQARYNSPFWNALIGKYEYARYFCTGVCQKARHCSTTHAPYIVIRGLQIQSSNMFFTTGACVAIPPYPRTVPPGTIPLCIQPAPAPGVTIAADWDDECAP